MRLPSGYEQEPWSRVMPGLQQLRGNDSAKVIGSEAGQVQEEVWKGRMEVKITAPVTSQ